MPSATSNLVPQLEVVPWLVQLQEFAVFLKYQEYVLVVMGCMDYRVSVHDVRKDSGALRVPFAEGITSFHLTSAQLEVDCTLQIAPTLVFDATLDFDCTKLFMLVFR